MRKFLVSIALASATVIAVPAVAQDHGRSGWNQRDDHRDHRGDFNRRGPSRQAVNQLLQQLNQVENRIQRSAQRRIISQREALSLRREANQIRNRLQRTSRNGLTGREYGELRQRVNQLQQHLRLERRDNDNRRY